MKEADLTDREREVTNGWKHDRKEMSMEECVTNADGTRLKGAPSDQVFTVNGREVDVVLWVAKRGSDWVVLMNKADWPVPQRDYDDVYPTREEARRRAYELVATWNAESDVADGPNGLRFAFVDYPDERDENGVCVCGAGPGMSHQREHDGAEDLTR
jgi:hypothetical protein